MFVFFADTPKELLRYVVEYIQEEREKALKAAKAAVKPMARKALQSEADGIGGILATLQDADVKPKEK